MFWDLIVTCTDLTTLQIEGCLPQLEFELGDFASVRDLYQAVNGQLVNMEKAGLITCEIGDLLELLRQIDYIFELCLTDNGATDILFRNSVSILKWPSHLNIA